MKSEHKIAAVCWAIVLLLLMASVARAAPSVNVGTLTLDNQPAYHQAASFEWTLGRKPSRIVTLGVFCSQDGWKYIAELPVSNALTGSGSVVIENEMSSAMPGHLDYTRPADCQAFLWDERLVSQGKPPAITGQVFFSISPESPL